MARYGVATPEKTKALAVAEVRKGRPLREVADEYAVSHVTVSRWVNEAGGSGPKAPAAPPPAAPAVPSAPTRALTLEEMLLVIQEQLQSAIQIAQDAKAVGHHDAAARAMGQFGKILPVLMAALKRAGEDRDVLKIPLAELEAARRSVAERMAAYAAREVHCAKCGREMRATAAGLAKGAQAQLFDHSKKPA